MIRKKKPECNATQVTRLAACLEQKPGTDWEPVAYASRFLSNLELRYYSTKEFEIVAVVWSLEHLNTTSMGYNSFSKRTTALLSALKENMKQPVKANSLPGWTVNTYPVICPLFKTQSVRSGTGTIRLRQNDHKRNKTRSIQELQMERTLAAQKNHK